MTRSFDEHEARYEELVAHSIGFAGRDHSFYVRAKAECLLALIREHVGDPALQRVVDVGCGPGITHRFLGEVGHLEGVDLSPSMIERAQRTNPAVRYHVGDAVDLSLEPDTFDAAFAIGLLHHVPADARRACVAELRRVLRPGGLAVIFEHNPLNPLTRMAVHRCEFDEDAVLLRRAETESLMRAAGLRVLGSRYIVIAPWTGTATRALERLLSRVPVGAQYYVAARV
jgi:SAM-dependent methyltransferase